MKVLVDTHVFLWSKANDPRLSPTAWATLRDPGNDLLLSSVSAAEMAIKVAVGKLTLATPLDQFIFEGMRNSHIAELPLRASHAVRVAALPLHHRDPFDRLLIAQAQAEGMALLTDDAEIRRYNVPIVW